MIVRQELYRKAFHLVALAIPALLLTAPRSATLVLVALGVAIAWTLELTRQRSAGVNRLFTRMFHVILRAEEARRITGATYLLTAALVTILIFDVALGSRGIAATALMFVIVGDTAAALVGQRFGRIHIGSKTLEGSLAHFLSGVALVWATALVEMPIGIVGALVAAITELMCTRRWNDNLTVPLVSGATMVLMAALTGTA